MLFPLADGNTAEAEATNQASEVVTAVDNMNPMPSRQSILANAFSPGTETDRPALFAGRQSQVEQLARSLHTAGEIPIIYGDRGLGKSSLAIQICSRGLVSITTILSGPSSPSGGRPRIRTDRAALT